MAHTNLHCSELIIDEMIAKLDQTHADEKKKHPYSYQIRIKRILDYNKCARDILALGVCVNARFDHRLLELHVKSSKIYIKDIKNIRRVIHRIVDIGDLTKVYKEFVELGVQPIKPGLVGGRIVMKECYDKCTYEYDNRYIENYSENDNYIRIGSNRLALSYGALEFNINGNAAMPNGLTISYGALEFNGDSDADIPEGQERACIQDRYVKRTEFLEYMRSCPEVYRNRETFIHIDGIADEQKSEDAIDAEDYRIRTHIDLMMEQFMSTGKRMWHVNTDEGYISDRPDYVKPSKKSVQQVTAIVAKSHMLAEQCRMID